MPFTQTFAGRIDSGSANNPALNLVSGEPALTFTFVNEDINGSTGDLILDGGGTGIADPNTVVQIGGQSYEFTLELTGTLPTSNNNGANQVPAALRGEPVYLITVFDYPTPGTTTRIAFVPDETVTTADWNAFGNGAIDVQNLDTTPPATAVCFAKGTAIATPRGDRPAETLRTGDVVMTADRGAQQVIWACQTRLEWCKADDARKPILISAGSMGRDLPRRDLVVSPQHRLVLRDPANGSEIMAPAHALTRFPGIRRMQGKRSVIYVHILLERHAVLFAERAPAESLYPGKMALSTLQPLARRALMAALRRHGSSPERYGPGARPFVTRRHLDTWTALHPPAANDAATPTAA